MKSAKVLLSQSEKVKFAVIWKLFVLSKANVVKQKGSQQDSKQFIQIYPEQISICIFVFLHSVIWSTKQVQIIIYRHKMKKRTAVVQIARFTQRWHYRLSQGRWQSERYWRRWETGKFQEEGLLGSFVPILIQYLSHSTNIHKYRDGNAVSRRRGTLKNMRELLQMGWFYKLQSHIYIAMNLD